MPRTIGRYTLWIMCCHTIENKVVPWNLLADHFRSNIALGMLIMVAAKACIIYGMYKLVLKIDHKGRAAARAKKKNENQQNN